MRHRSTVASDKHLFSALHLVEQFAQMRLYLGKVNRNRDGTLI